MQMYICVQLRRNHYQKQHACTQLLTNMVNIADLCTKTPCHDQHMCLSVCAPVCLLIPLYFSQTLGITITMCIGYAPLHPPKR